MMRLVLFVAALMSAVAARAADVERYLIQKGRHYFQLSQSAPIIQTNNAFRFNANVYATTNGNVKGGSIIPPNAAGQNLLPDADGDPYRVREKFDEAYLLERFYPNGSYVLNIQTLHDGNKALTHNISGDTYPNPPMLLNYEGAQNLPYNFYNELTWSPFVGGTTNDFIQVQIENANGDNVFETPDFGKPGAVNGTATRVLLEPGDLVSGVLYVGTITFTKVLQNGSASYPGVPGAVGYFSRTEFPVHAIVSSFVPAIDRVEIFETHRFLQTTNSPPAEESEPWQFRARVDITSPGILTNVTMLSPANTNYTIPADGIERFQFDDLWGTQLALRNVFPPGDYKFTTSRANGVQEQWTVALPNGQAPAAPVLSGLPVGLHEATNNLTITWTPWTGTSELDYIRVQVEDELGNDVFESPNFTSDKRLRGDATSMTIPAAAFLPGRSYSLTVTFRKVLSMQTRAIPGALTLSGYASRTRFAFSTIPRDLVRYGVSLGRIAWQHSTNEPTYEDAPFSFEATMNLSSPASVSNASVWIPGGATFPLSLSTNGVALLFQMNQGFDSALANFPTGIYSFRYTGTNDGAKTSSVTLASKEFPPQPKLRNFSSLGTVSGGPAASFPISWEPWEGARAGRDYVRLIIEDMRGVVVLDTGVAGTLDAQSGTNSSFGIAGNLAALRSYIGHLRFESVDQFADPFYPGPVGYASVYSETRFYISTLGPGRFTIPSRSMVNLGSELQFVVSPVMSNRLYRVEVKTDSTSWTPLQTNQSPNGGTFQIRTPHPAEKTYFRVGLLP